MRVSLVWWLACLLWSSTYLFLKLGLAEIPPWSFAWLRLVLALCVLAPLTMASHGFRHLSQRDVARVFSAGILLLGANYALLYWGARHIPSGLVAILQSATPVFALLLGWCFGAEQVTVRKLLAITIGCAGVVLIFGSRASASGTAALSGALAVLVSSACVAFAYAWLKARESRADPLTVTTLQCIAGTVVLAPIALIVEGNPFKAQWSAASAFALLYLGIGGSVVAFWLNYWLLNRMDASAMLMMGIAEVPIAIALGAVVFGERLPSGTFVGAACILAAVGLTQTSNQRS